MAIVAVGQMNSKPLDITSNLEKMESLVSEAARGSAELILLPELCLTGYRADEAFGTAGTAADRGVHAGAEPHLQELWRSDLHLYPGKE